MEYKTNCNHIIGETINLVAQINITHLTAVLTRMTSAPQIVF